MSYTKRQFCEAIFDELGLSSYAFDMPTEQYQKTMRRLDAMMAEWNARGIRLGYPIPSSPEGGDLDAETEVPDSAWTAIITNGAIRIAPSFGKQVMPETKVTAKQSYNTLLSLAAMPAEQQFPSTLPAGAGNKPWNYDRAFVAPPSDGITTGPDAAPEFS